MLDIGAEQWKDGALGDVWCRTFIVGRCLRNRAHQQNLTALAVMEANGSIFTNKYSEGLPGARYYGGNEVSLQYTLLALLWGRWCNGGEDLSGEGTAYCAPF